MLALGEKCNNLESYNKDSCKPAESAERVQRLLDQLKLETAEMLEQGDELTHNINQLYKGVHSFVKASQIQSNRANRNGHTMTDYCSDTLSSNTAVEIQLNGETLDTKPQLQNITQTNRNINLYENVDSSHLQNPYLLESPVREGSPSMLSAEHASTKRKSSFKIVDKPLSDLRYSPLKPTINSPSYGIFNSSTLKIGDYLHVSSPGCSVSPVCTLSSGYSSDKDLSLPDDSLKQLRHLNICDDSTLLQQSMALKTRNDLENSVPVCDNIGEYRNESGIHCDEELSEIHSYHVRNAIKQSSITNKSLYGCVLKSGNKEKANHTEMSPLTPVSSSHHQEDQKEVVSLNTGSSSLFRGESTFKPIEPACGQNYGSHIINCDIVENGNRYNSQSDDLKTIGRNNYSHKLTRHHSLNEKKPVTTSVITASSSSADHGYCNVTTYPPCITDLPGFHPAWITRNNMHHFKPYNFHISPFSAFRPFISKRNSSNCSKNSIANNVSIRRSQSYSESNTQGRNQNSLNSKLSMKNSLSFAERQTAVSNESKSKQWLQQLRFNEPIYSKEKAVAETQAVKNIELCSDHDSGRESSDDSISRVNAKGSHQSSQYHTGSSSGFSSDYPDTIGTADSWKFSSISTCSRSNAQNDLDSFVFYEPVDNGDDDPSEHLYQQLPVNYSSSKSSTVCSTPPQLPERNQNSKYRSCSSNNSSIKTKLHSSRNQNATKNRRHTVNLEDIIRPDDVIHSSNAHMYTVADILNSVDSINKDIPDKENCMNPPPYFSLTHKKLSNSRRTLSSSGSFHSHSSIPKYSSSFSLVKNQSMKSNTTSNSLSSRDDHLNKELFSPISPKLNEAHTAETKKLCKVEDNPTEVNFSGSPNNPTGFYAFPTKYGLQFQSGSHNANSTLSRSFSQLTLESSVNQQSQIVDIASVASTYNRSGINWLSQNSGSEVFC